ncbi:MAG: hypothetical protein ACM3YM_04345 [Sphingomonadales bacterium]
MVRATTLVLALLLSPVSASAATLNLICIGSASIDPSATIMTTPNEHRYNIDEAVTIRLNEDNTGEARVPRKLLPPVRYGHDGWYKLIKVKRTDNEITGVVRFNEYNKPRLRLDRITGLITLQGPNGDFSGRCEPYDPATVQRKF